MKLKAIFRRHTALICVLALLLGMAPVAAATSPTITVGETETLPGGYVGIWVRAQNLESLAALSLEIYYDSEALNLSSHSEYEMDSVTVNTDTPGKLLYDAIDLEGVSGDISLLYLYFAVAEDAAVGEYPVNIAVGEAYNVSLQSVELDGKAGKITVTAPNAAVPELGWYISMSSDTVTSGEDVSVTLYSYNTNGLAAGNFEFCYDSQLLQFKSLELKDAMKPGEALYEINSESAGRVLLSYAALNEVSGGELMVLTLTAKAAIEPSSTEIEVKLSDLYTLDNTAMAPDTRRGTVNIAPLEEEEQAPQFWLEAPESVSTGDTFTVIAWVQGVSAIGAADFRISYDMSKLKCENVQTATEATGQASVNGSMLMTNPNFSEGVIKFSLVNSDGISQDEALVHISFTVIENKDATVTISATGTGVVDADFNAVSLCYKPADITVDGLIHSDDYTVNFFWSEDGTKASYYASCNCGCGYTETGDAVMSSEVTTEATCVDFEITSYTASVSIDGKTYTATNDVMGQLGDKHSWNDENVCAGCGLEGISMELSADGTKLSVTVNNPPIIDGNMTLLLEDAGPNADRVELSIPTFALRQVEGSGMVISTAMGTFSLSAGNVNELASAEGLVIRFEKSIVNGLTVYSAKLTDSAGHSISLPAGGISLELNVEKAESTIYFVYDFDAEGNKTLARTVTNSEKLVIPIPTSGKVGVNYASLELDASGAVLSFGEAPTEYTVVIALYGDDGRMHISSFHANSTLGFMELSWSGKVSLDHAKAFFLDSTGKPIAENLFATGD